MKVSVSAKLIFMCSCAESLSIFFCFLSSFRAFFSMFISSSSSSSSSSPPSLSSSSEDDWRPLASSSSSSSSLSSSLSSSSSSSDPSSGSFLFMAAGEGLSQAALSSVNPWKCSGLYIFRFYHIFCFKLSYYVQIC